MQTLFDRSISVDFPVECISACSSAVIFCSGNLLYVWFLADDDPREPIELPFQPATMCSHDSKVLLACSDSVLLMSLDEQEVAVEDLSILPTGSKLFPFISFSCFSPTGDAALVIGLNVVSAVQVIDEMRVTSWDSTPWFGAADCILTAAFGPTTIVFVVAKNNHLIAFDEQCGSLVKDGGIVCSATVVTSLIYEPKKGTLLVGISDGTVKVLDGSTLQKIAVIDIKRELCRSFSSDDFDPETLQCSITELQISGPLLVCATPAAIVCLTRDSFAVADIDCFENSGAVTALSQTSGVRISWFPFSSSIRAQCRITDVAAAIKDAQSAGELDWVHAKTALPEALTRPLEITREATDPKKSKPVTFGRAIRSSGYTNSQPWSVQQAAKKAKKAAQAKPTASAAPLKYNMDAGPPLIESAKANAALAASPPHSTAVLSACFDGSGACCVTGGADGSISMIKMPIAAKCDPVAAFRAHTTMIQTIDCSLNLQHGLVVTGAFDGTVSLWRPSRREAAYVVQSTGKEVRSAKFFYNDHLLVVASGGNILFSKWALDDGGGDLDRKRNDSKLAEVRRFSTGAQQVNSVDCFNAFASTVVAWVGSNKQIGIYDVAAEANIRLIDEAHSRNIHSLEMLRSSRFAAVDTSALHMFATASLDKSVKLWDMRQENPVRTMFGHSNSALKVGLCWSPCGKFVVVGSEDRSAYVYDAGSGNIVTKLPMNDTVTVAKYHPVAPVVLLGSASGSMKLFSSKV